MLLHRSCCCQGVKGCLPWALVYFHLHFKHFQGAKVRDLLIKHLNQMSEKVNCPQAALTHRAARYKA